MISERRRARRFFGSVGVVSSDSEGLNFSFIKNISRDGVYIETEKLQSHGEQFRFVLSNGKTSAHVTGRVVRSRDAFFHGGRSGMGVRFEKLDGLGKVLRDDLLLYLMNLRYQKIWEAA